MPFHLEVGGVTGTPWIWTPCDVTRSAISVATSLHMAASSEHRRPESIAVATEYMS